MNDATDTTQLNTCGCCETGVEELTHENRPGLSAINYRIGTHASFLRRMLTRLSQQEIPDGDNIGQRPLADLTTRSKADPAIALLDACATIADVLTFYEERIANEGYLRTATERRSVLELARAISYELNPGVAASTYLVFTVDDSDSTPDKATIAAGTQVQSIPAKEGELPQTFETTAEFEARVEWNALKPRTTEPHEIASGTTDMYLAGVATQLQPGDAVLLVGDDRERWPGSERWDFRIVQTVETFPEVGYTRVTWQPGLGHESPTVEPADNPRAFVFKQRAALFGHNAPDWRTMPDNIKLFYDPDWNADNPDRRKTQWPDFEIQTVEDNLIDLDATYPKILIDSWIVLAKPSYVELYKVVEATTDSRTDYTLTAQVTRLELDTREHLSWFGLRDTAVFAQSEALVLAEKPLTTPMAGNTIELDRQVDGLQPGQPIIVTGNLELDDEAERSEVAFIDDTSDSNNRTTLILQDGLENIYLRSTVTVYANATHATHGETVAGEVLGSGDGARTHQQFGLKRLPLTYVSANTVTGSESTLELRVNGILWQRVASLYTQNSADKSYIVRIDNNANATAIFGDGKRGTRLPTGRENIQATYRFGIGSDGEVGENALTLLKKRPFGVRSVNNPVAAIGAANPEKLENARTNAPLTVLTLDRIVSLQDFEDFARAFAGIGKAQAISLWNGESNLVHITVADDNGDPVPPDTINNLREAIDLAREPSVAVEIGNYEALSFFLDARVLYDSAYLSEKVRVAAEDALRQAFSFDLHQFGQPVTAAAIVSTIHQIDGVIAADLEALLAKTVKGEALAALSPANLTPQLLSFLGTSSLGATDETSAPASVLPAQTARWVNGTIEPAQLLLLDDAGIHLTMQAI